MIKLRTEKLRKLPNVIQLVICSVGIQTQIVWLQNPRTWPVHYAASLHIGFLTNGNDFVVWGRDVISVKMCKEGLDAITQCILKDRKH